MWVQELKKIQIIIRLLHLGNADPLSRVLPRTLENGFVSPSLGQQDSPRKIPNITPGYSPSTDSTKWRLLFFSLPAVANLGWSVLTVCGSIENGGKISSLLSQGFRDLHFNNIIPCSLLLVQYQNRQQLVFLDFAWKSSFLCCYYNSDTICPPNIVQSVTFP